MPSRFGFVVGLHPRDPDTIYVIPEDQVLGEDAGGGIRYVTDAKFRVFRSRDGGAGLGAPDPGTASEQRLPPRYAGRYGNRWP